MGAWQIKVAIAMGVFVVLCFLTECIPFRRRLSCACCIGLILVFTGVVGREESPCSTGATPAGLSWAA